MEKQLERRETFMIARQWNDVRAAYRKRLRDALFDHRLSGGVLLRETAVNHSDSAEIFGLPAVWWWFAMVSYYIGTMVRDLRHISPLTDRQTY